MGRLGVRNAARRRGRSLATMALLACGSFMVVAVGANRRSVDVDPRNRQSGTGGFALHAQSTFAVYGDPDAEEFRAEEGLAGLGEGVKFVPFRVREGDDASCLNLNRAQQPRLMGVDPAEMARRDAFSFKDTLTDAEHPWKLLRWDGKGPVPAIVDGATLQWSLYKKLGQTISYTDDQGRPFEVKFVAALAPSILQGSVIIGEEAFLEKYPSAGGYKTFLVDVPQGRIEEIAKALRKAFRGEGMEVTPTTERLRMFFELENTYLSIFQLLGGLGMLIGSIGLGLVVLRNVLERRGELALMRAVGYRRSDLKRLILAEHVGLLAAGLVCGTVSAAVAVAPVVEQAGTELPLFSLGVTLGAVLASGLLWTYLATTVALRGPLMEALRSE